MADWQSELQQIGNQNYNKSGRRGTETSVQRTPSQTKKAAWTGICVGYHYFRFL